MFGDVADGAVPEFRLRGSLDGREHLPACVAPLLLTRDAVHVEDRFDSLRSVCTLD